jgi:Outer membrane protein beta-barrel domain
MLDSAFENKVQQKMEELTLAPADTVWQKIENGLPQKKEPRRRLIFMLLFLLVTAGLILFWINAGPADHTLSPNAGTAMDNRPEKAAPGNITTATPPVSGNPVSQTAPSATGGYSNAANKKSAAVTGIKALKINGDRQGNVAAEDFTLVAGKKIVSHTRSKTKVKIAASVAEEQKEPALEQMDKTSAPENLPLGNSAIAAAFDSSSNKKEEKSMGEKDTARPVIAGISNKKQRLRKWKWGIETGAGVSNVSSNLFSNKPVYADVAQFNSGSSAGTPQANRPANPTASFSLTAGFFAEKNVSKKWKFSTGIHYAYQSNSIRVGSRVDSSTSLNFNNSNVAVDNYYRYGTSVNYKNKFHLLQVPFIFKYSPVTKWPLYAEAGPVLSYLMQSGALVYGSNAVFINHKNVFNKAGLSISAGAGADLAKHSGVPFSIGFRFNYGFGSATKEPFAPQHLQSSLLYIKIPFRK